jgi:hypothetical protein
VVRSCSGAASARVFAVASALVTALAAAPAGGQGFVGETRCANPTCHGAALPSTPIDPSKGCTEKYAGTDWRPWKSARTQWLNQNIDRHSRAYKTLTSESSKRIATYMGIDATTSPKCLGCHAPPAPLAADSKHRPSDGVTCEHCHGPAEKWLEPHKAKDWRQQQAQFAALGFYDNADLRLRAEKCASCHVEIDHEIIAGGHPPLQFEMVAYAQVMKHWDDCTRLPPNGADPTLWAIGQIVGLRHAAAAIAHRAGADNYQSLGQFPHFKDQNCYQCHHKLVEDATRQAQGHVDMTDVILSTLSPGAQAQLAAHWQEVLGGVSSNAATASQKATELREWLAPFEEQLLARAADQKAQALLCRMASGGPDVGRVRRFAFTRPPNENVLRLQEIGLPWWYTTGTREQIALGIQALCPPAFGIARCATITPDLRNLVAAANRADSDPAEFATALGAIKTKLCK